MPKEKEVKEIDAFDTTWISADNLKKILQEKRADGWKVKGSAGKMLILKRKPVR